MVYWGGGLLPLDAIYHQGQMNRVIHAKRDAVVLWVSCPTICVCLTLISFVSFIFFLLALLGGFFSDDMCILHHSYLKIKEVSHRASYRASSIDHSPNDFIVSSILGFAIPIPKTLTPIAWEISRNGIFSE